MYIFRNSILSSKVKDSDHKTNKRGFMVLLFNAYERKIMQKLSIPGILFQSVVDIHFTLWKRQQIMLGRIKCTPCSSRIDQRWNVNLGCFPSFDVAPPYSFKSKFDPSFMPDTFSHFLFCQSSGNRRHIHSCPDLVHSLINRRVRSGRLIFGFPMQAFSPADLRKLYSIASF